MADQQDPTSYENLVFPPQTGSNALVTPKSAGTKGSSIANDIELNADFYVPSMYNLLGFFSNFRVEDDANTSFIPVSQTKANPKLFVVGIIPPQVNITGRLLNRSASIGDVTADPVEMTDDVAAEVTSVAPSGRVTAEVGPNAKGAGLPDSFWNSYVLMCQRLQCDPYEMAAVLYKESGFDPTAHNDKSNAQGLCQFIQRVGTSKRIGMDQDTWNKFCTLSAEQQLPYVENYYKGKVTGKDRAYINYVTFGGYKNPDGSLYASKETQDAWIAAHPQDAGRFKNAERQAEAVSDNPKAARDGRITIDSLADAGQLHAKPPQSIKDRIAAAQEFVLRNGLSPFKTPVAQPEAAPAEWQGSGSASASSAKKEVAKTADKNQLRSLMEAKYQNAQRAEIANTVKALNALRDAPPLRLLVNPSSFKISSEKIVSDGNWTRNGPIVEHWGENQDKIEASGKVAAFFAIDAASPNPNAEGQSPGLTRGARQYSASYQNFLSLYLLYRNNANLYTTGQDNSDSKTNFLNRLSLVGSMYVYYDNTLYVGSFDNFNITESETSPYTLEYNFQFTVRATFLLDGPPMYEPQAQQFLSKRMVLPTTSQPVGDEDYSSVPLPAEAATPTPPGYVSAEDFE